MTDVLATTAFERPYVRTDVGRLQGAIVVPPALTIDRLHPLHAEPYPIPLRAREQHEILRRTLADYGVKLTLLDGDNNEAPTTTFVADCAVMLESGAVLMRPTAIERRREVDAVEVALQAAGIPIVGRIETPGLLDGGDVAIANGTAYIGVPKAPLSRSNTVGRRQFEAIAQNAGLRTVELTMGDVPRLRSVLTFVADDLAVAATERVDVVPLGAVTVVEVPRGEEFAAGLLTLGPRRALANLRFRTALPILRRAKIEIVAIDCWEFGKLGYAPSALVLPLKRG